MLQDTQFINCTKTFKAFLCVCSLCMRLFFNDILLNFQYSSFEFAGFLYFLLQRCQKYSTLHEFFVFFNQNQQTVHKQKAPQSEFRTIRAVPVRKPVSKSQRQNQNKKKPNKIAIRTKSNSWIKSCISTSSSRLWLNAAYWLDLRGLLSIRIMHRTTTPEWHCPQQVSPSHTHKISIKEIYTGSSTGSSTGQSGRDFFFN